MSQNSGFFNATEISPGQYDNVYDAADFAFLFELFFGNGVFVDPANQLMVQAKSGLTVTVQPGAAFIDGYWYHLTEPMDVSFPADGQGTYSVVLQFDGEKIEIPPNAVLQSEKVETVMLTSYVLAQVNMTGGMTNITNANITDRRGQSNYCGFVSSTIKQIDTTDLFLQFQTAFDEFMATIEGALGDDVAGNLLNKITKTQAMIAEPYDEGTQYNANDYAIYQDVLKKCIASTTGTYDQTKWTDASVVEDLSYIAQSFQDGCSVIAAAITSMGVPTAVNASPEQMAANIQLIMPELTGNAGTAQVLSGYTFYSNNPKSKQTGTMVNRGAITGSVNAGGTYTIPEGYHNGSGKVTGNSLSSQTSASATAAQILSGYTAWVNGAKITGTMANRGALNWSGSNTTYSVPAGWYSGGTIDSRPSYTNGYNAGVNAGRRLKSKTYTAPETTSDYTWKNTGNGNDIYGHIQVNLNLGTHTIVGAYWYNSDYSDSWILTCNGYMMRQNKKTFTRQDTGPTGGSWATAPVLHLPSGGSGSHTVIVWYV